MKKSMRLFAVLLCILMVITMFTACGKSEDVEWVTSEIVEEVVEDDVQGDNNVNDSNKTESNTQNNKDSTSSEVKVENNFIKSLRGTKVNIISLNGAAPKRGTVTGDRHYSNIAKISSKYGVTIKYVEDSVSNEALLTSIVSGKPIANVFTVETYNISSYLKASAVAPLDEAMKESGVTFNEEWYDQNVKNVLNVGGHHYAWNASTKAPYVITYNKRLLELKGLEDPMSLYNKGQWTFDMLETYAKKLTEKTATGEVTVGGFEMPSTPELADYLTHMNGGSLIALKNGAMTLNVSDKKTMKGMEYFYKWTKDDIATVPGEWTQCYVNFTKGKAAMVLGTNYVFEAINENGMKDAAGVVPFPKGPDAPANINPMYERFDAWMIPKAAQKDAAKILFIMNELHKADYANREKDFEDTYKHIILDKSAYETFKSLTLGNNLTLGYNQVSGMTYGSGSLWDMVSRIIMYKETPATAYAATRVGMETRLKDNWKGLKFTGK